MVTLQDWGDSGESEQAQTQGSLLHLNFRNVKVENIERKRGYRNSSVQLALSTAETFRITLCLWFG